MLFPLRGPNGVIPPIPPLLAVNDDGVFIDGGSGVRPAIGILKGLAPTPPAVDIGV